MGYEQITLTQAEVMTDISNLMVETGMNAQLNMGGVSPFVDLITKGTFVNGDSIAIRTANLQTERDYKTEKTNGRTKLTPDMPKLDEQVIKADTRKFVEITVEQYATAGAFANEGSLQSFVVELLSIPQKTKQAKIYGVGLKMLQDWNPDKDTQNVEVPMKDLDALDAPAEAAAAATNAKKIYKTLELVLDNMTAPTTDYTDLKDFFSANAAEDFVILLNSRYKADMKVDVVASLFNSDKLEGGLPRIITIPTKQLNAENQSTICWLFHKDKLQLYYRFIVATSMFDEYNLWSNHWLSYKYGNKVIRGLPGVKITAAQA